MRSLFLIIGAVLFLSGIGKSWGESDYEQDALYDYDQGSRDARLSGDLLSFVGDSDYYQRFKRQQEDDFEDQDDGVDDDQRDVRFIGNLLNGGGGGGGYRYRRQQNPKAQTQGALKEPNHVLAIGQTCFRDGRAGFCKNSVCCCQPGKLSGVCMSVTDLSTDKWCWKSY